jgi:hypothetical protein
MKSGITGECMTAGQQLQVTVLTAQQPGDG